MEVVCKSPFPPVQSCADLSRDSNITARHSNPCSTLFHEGSKLHQPFPCGHVLLSPCAQLALEAGKSTGRSLCLVPKDSLYILIMPDQALTSPFKLQGAESTHHLSESSNLDVKLFSTLLTVGPPRTCAAGTSQTCSQVQCLYKSSLRSLQQSRHLPKSSQLSAPALVCVCKSQ